MRRWAVAAAIAVVALASLPGVPAGAASALKPPPLATGSYRQLPAPELVNVHELPASVARPRFNISRAALVKNHATPSLPSPANGGGTRGQTIPSLPSPASRGVTRGAAVLGTVQEQLTVFPGIDITQGVTAFGQDNNMEPPDTQIAVGPNVVVEMVNANMSVWSKSGMRLAITDLNVFYGVPAGSTLTDPRVLYDPSSGRFIASAVAINGSTWDSLVYLAVSQSPDPTGTWAKQGLKTTSAVLMDQPKVGSSDDKIAVAWSEWLKPGCDPANPTFACFIGDVYTVVDKGDMLGGSPALEYMTGRDIFRYAIIPVQALSSTTTQYLAYNNADPFNLVENGCGIPPTNVQYWNCPAIGIISITGSVHLSTLFISEVDRPINATTSLPKAVQQGNAALLDTGDDRLLSAVWQNNQLWTSSGDGNFCPMANPNGPGPRACGLIIEVRTDTNPMTVQEKTIDSGDFVYHPAISLDNAGDLFVVFTRSSSTMYPSVWVNGWLAGTNTWTPITLLTAGTGFYDSKTACGGTNRWGDYSGASVDGTDPTDVWVAGEYAVTAANNCTWKTALGRLTFSAPTVASVKAATGPGAGGTSVTITGTDFMSGATTVYFGATPAATGTTTVLSPNSLTVITPPGNSLVYLSASTADGHGPLGAVFKYPKLEAAPGSLASRPGGVLRGGAPPHVPPKPTGTRPLIQASLLSPLVGEGQRQGLLTQPLRLFRLLLL